MSRLLVTAFAAAALSACGVSSMAPDRDPRGDLRLAQALAGKVADRPVSCLPSYRTTNAQVIDEDTILYRDGRTTYVQHTNGACYPHGPNGGTYLVTRSFGSAGLCRGDIAQVVHATSGSFAGSCAFNDFIPYRTPGR